MTINKLRERIKIQHKSHISDQVGGYQLTWAHGGEFWAEVKPTTSASETQGDTTNLQMPRYSVRWRVGIDVPRSAKLWWKGKSLRLLTMPQEDVCRRWVRALAILEDSHE